ncbi:serine/threonine-protein kinase [Streptomyces sp. NPDC059095]|uniref:serine/threonine-protein kinase n=1 Tax=Streptomyces sp. NPDC059095 TaxID=3346726 RepID=UPI0036A75E49
MGEGLEDRLVGGRYRLVSELGAGGFGQVWKAWDENLRVDVAVKALFVPREGSPQEQADRTRRAIREARNAAQLRTHPNIVSVHDVITEEGVPWIVMELVTGHSLEAEIRARGRIPGKRLREIAEAVLEALTAAHAVGIVHRDVKPPNVLLGDDGRILLADFGIAMRDSDTRMTGTGLVIGTPQYMAPERITRHDDAPAGDLFSLAVTLYEAAAGTSPFQRDSPEATLAAILAHTPPAPAQAGELASLITDLLAKDPSRRPTAPQALAVLDQLRTPAPTKAAHTASSSDTEAPTKDPERRITRAGPAFAAVFLLLGLLMLGGTVVLLVNATVEVNEENPLKRVLQAALLDLSTGFCAGVGALCLHAVFTGGDTKRSSAWVGIFTVAVMVLFLVLALR